MNNQKEIQVSNNNQTTTNTNAINTAMIALLLTLVVLFGGIIYENNNQAKKIDKLTDKTNTFISKYLNEQSEADNLAKDLCETKFSGFAPHLRYELDDGRVCRIVIENTFADTTGKWQKLFDACKMNTSADLPNQHKLLRGKCGSLNVEVFVKNAAHQK